MDDNNNNNINEFSSILETNSANQGEPNAEFIEPSSPLIIPFSPPPPLFPLNEEVEMVPMPPIAYNSRMTPTPDFVGVGLGIGNHLEINLLPPQTTDQDLQQVLLPSLATMQSTEGTRVPQKRKSRARKRKNSEHEIKKIVPGIPVEKAMKCDSWGWRKYGQKPIKGTPHPRAYYKCSTEPDCPARKNIEKSVEDPNFVIITYTCDHSHQFPLRLNSLSGTTRSKKNQGCGSLSELSPTTPLAAHISSQTLADQEQQVVVEKDTQIPREGEEQQLAVEDIDTVREGELVFVGGGDHHDEAMMNVVDGAAPADAGYADIWDGFDDMFFYRTLYGGDDNDGDDDDDDNGAGTSGGDLW